MKAKLFAGGTLALALVFTPAATSADADKDIVDVAVANPDFSTLVAAVKEAGLVETLKGKGPFTVLAPTNAAFKKLGDDKVKAVLADKEMLKKVLLAHVVAGKVPAADVAGLNGKDVKTVGGSTFRVSTAAGVSIGNAKVVKADVPASNGIIHVIDTVLIPTN